MYQLSDLCTWAREYLGEPPGSNRLPNSDLKDSANRAYRKVAGQGNCMTRITTAADTGLVTADGVAIYDMPADYHRLINAWINGATRPLTRILRGQMNSAFSAWSLNVTEVAPTAVTHIYEAGNKKFGLYPIPNASGTVIFMTIYCIPVASPTTGGYSELSADTDVPLIDPQFHEMILWEMVRDLASGKLLDSQKAQDRAREAERQYLGMLPVLQQNSAMSFGLLGGEKMRELVLAQASVG